jgi:hypothetical protein
MFNTINHFVNFRAARATKEGHFKAEIIPVTVNVTDKNGEEKTITVSALLCSDDSSYHVDSCLYIQILIF